MGPRQFDVVVFGATGFTGALCAEYLAAEYPLGGDVRWAIAGRSVKKLKKVQEELAELGQPDVPYLVADSSDLSALRDMCAQTEVVLSTVGPFLKYGSLLVEACVAEGTCYCDSTGETPWVLKMIREHHKAAEAANARIVPSCGYDSLPSDLGTLKLVKAVQEAGAKPGPVTHVIGPTRGGLSGGTASTMLAMFGADDKKLVAKAFSDPNSLAPKGAELQGRNQQFFGYFSPAGFYTAPFFMAPANGAIVRRSAGLLPEKYGSGFAYSEVLGLASMVAALGVSFGLNFGALFMLLPPVRWILEKYVLPDPGQGPSRRKRDKGFFTSAVHTKASNGRHFVCKVKGANGDPGYKSTSMMLVETAVQLATTRDQREGHGGVLTTASCQGLGDDLVDALAQNSVVTFEVVSGEEGIVKKNMLPADAKAKL